MENQNPLEMQSPDLNQHQSPHLSQKSRCAFCGTALKNNTAACPNCGAQSEQVFTPTCDDSMPTPPYKESINKVIDHRSETIKGRLKPNHNKPIDKRKLLYSVIIIILTLVAIGLLGNQ